MISASLGNNRLVSPSEYHTAASSGDDRLLSSPSTLPQASAFSPRNDPILIQDNLQQQQQAINTTNNNASYQPNGSIPYFPQNIENNEQCILFRSIHRSVVFTAPPRIQPFNHGYDLVRFLL
mmetsp:Transcript_55281/g.61683  ORF Transcript_55281/g.61683 Transcript_55281/m.61683 type:complete len:122 (-) Transcript_55281:60-425(-)